MKLYIYIINWRGVLARLKSVMEEEIGLLGWKMLENDYVLGVYYTYGVDSIHVIVYELQFNEIYMYGIQDGRESNSGSSLITHI